MRLKQILKNICLMAVGLPVLLSCSDDMPEPGTRGDGAEVSLHLKVGLLVPDYRSAGSRAAGEYPSGYPYDFEPAATVYEGVNTLRVIILTSDRVVEHNRIFNFPDRAPVNGDVYDDMVFKVKSGETKRIYLIANEKTITPDLGLADYVPGNMIADDTAADWQMYNSWPDGPEATAQPYVDNTGTDKSYVPMSEYFDVYIEEPAEGTSGDVIRYETLFLTRSVVKFSFYMSSESDLYESFRISKIQFNSLMQKSYVMPRATYSPAKYPLSGDTKRIVTEFTTPGFAGNMVFPYTFEPENFGLNGTSAETKWTDTYAPELYFGETANSNADNEFYITCTGEFEDGEKVTFDTKAMPNLPSFPRNTHVKVYFTIKDRKLSAQVILMPYIGIWLDPIFGVGGNAAAGPTTIRPI